MKIFALYDKVAKRYVSTTMAESEELFVRNSLIAILMDYSINDVDFYCVGYIDEEYGIIKPCVPRLCDWECYKFPLNRNEKDKFLTMEQIIDFASKKKNEFLESCNNNLDEIRNEISALTSKMEKSSDKKEIESIKYHLKYLTKREKELAKVVKHE